VASWYAHRRCEGLELPLEPGGVERQRHGRPVRDRTAIVALGCSSPYSPNDSTLISGSPPVDEHLDLAGAYAI